MTYHELCALSKAELEKVSCTCVSCDACHGVRSVMEPGINPPFDDPASCDDCDGTGTVDTCDRCQLLTEMDQSDEDW